VFLLSSHQRPTETSGDLGILHGKKLWCHDQKAGRECAQLATCFRVAIRGADPEIYAVKGGGPRRSKSQLSEKMAKEGARIRVMAPEVKDMDIDEALEEVWGTVGARKGSNRSNVFIVHFDNGTVKECQKDWIYIHLRNETEN